VDEPDGEMPAGPTRRPSSRLVRRIQRLSSLTLLASALGCGSTPLEPWHTAQLTEEFTAERAAEVATFDGYRQLEDRLFAELQEEVYAQVGSGPGFELFRYSAGSLADPAGDATNWNRSFELSPAQPIGGVLLLHGMSDSPYSLRALAETLMARGYQVIGLRLPGHGTAPSGLRKITAGDMTAAVNLAMEHLASALGGRPIHMVGYSTGAALALDFAIDALEGTRAPVPASLVLISPAVRIHAAASWASFKDRMSLLPGLGSWSWLSVLPEFDPYKYNSFATNAGTVVHRLTRDVDRRLAARARAHPDRVLPPTLVLKSAVDSTVLTEAVVDNLLGILAPHRHELVLFDINRRAAKSWIMVSDPRALTDRLRGDDSLPFAVTFVANQSPETNAVTVRRKPPFSAETASAEPYDLTWPPGVISLSHVALPIAPDDALYGSQAPADGAFFLGDLAVLGERGLLALPADWLLRMRYNPFYSVLEQRVLEWFAENDGGPAAGRAEAGAGPDRAVIQRIAEGALSPPAARRR